MDLPRPDGSGEGEEDGRRRRRRRRRGGGAGVATATSTSTTTTFAANDDKHPLVGTRPGPLRRGLAFLVGSIPGLYFNPRVEDRDPFLAEGVELLADECFHLGERVAPRVEGEVAEAVEVV